MSVFPDPGLPAVITATMRAAQAMESSTEHWLTVITHAWFLFPIIVAGFFHLWHAATFITIEALISIVYHACFAFDVCSGLDPTLTHTLDLIGANLLIVAVLMVAAGTRDDDVKHFMHIHYYWIAIPVQVLSVVFAQLVAPFSYWVSYVAWTAALLLLYVYALFFRAPKRIPMGAGAYVIDTMAPAWHWLIMSFLSLGGALACFAVPVHTTILHSLWHVFAAIFLGTFMLALYLPPTTPVTILAYRYFNNIKEAAAIRTLLLARIREDRARARERRLARAQRREAIRQAEAEHQARRQRRRLRRRGGSRERELAHSFFFL